MPLCKAGKFGALKVSREDEFAPVKNANPTFKEDKGFPDGIDCPKTAREFLMKQHKRFLHQALNEKN